MTLSFLQCLGQLEKTSEGIVADAAKFHRSLGGGGETAEAHDSCQGVPWRRARAQATLHRMDTTLEGDQLWAAQWQKVRCGAGQGETNHLTSAIPPTQRRDTMAARRRTSMAALEAMLPRHQKKLGDVLAFIRAMLPTTTHATTALPREEEESNLFGNVLQSGTQEEGPIDHAILQAKIQHLLAFMKATLPKCVDNDMELGLEHQMERFAVLSDDTTRCFKKAKEIKAQIKRQQTNDAKFQAREEAALEQELVTLESDIQGTNEDIETKKALLSTLDTEIHQLEQEEREYSASEANEKLESLKAQHEQLIEKIAARRKELQAIDVTLATQKQHPFNQTVHLWEQIQNLANASETTTTSASKYTDAVEEQRRHLDEVMSTFQTWIQRQRRDLCKDEHLRGIQKTILCRISQGGEGLAALEDALDSPSVTPDPQDTGENASSTYSDKRIAALILQTLQSPPPSPLQHDPSNDGAHPPTTGVPLQTMKRHVAETYNIPLPLITKVFYALVGKKVCLIDWRTKDHRIQYL